MLQWEIALLQTTDSQRVLERMKTNSEILACQLAPRILPGIDFSQFGND
jgi:hypothetical protein